VILKSERLPHSDYASWRAEPKRPQIGTARSRLAGETRHKVCGVAGAWVAVSMQKRAACGHLSEKRGRASPGLKRNGVKYRGGKKQKKLGRRGLGTGFPSTRPCSRRLGRRRKNNIGKTPRKRGSGQLVATKRFRDRRWRTGELPLTIGLFLGRQGPLTGTVAFEIATKRHQVAKKKSGGRIQRMEAYGKKLCQGEGSERYQTRRAKALSRRAAEKKVRKRKAGKS